jgi:hypothetical protein
MNRLKVTIDKESGYAFLYIQLSEDEGFTFRCRIEEMQNMVNSFTNQMNS